MSADPSAPAPRPLWQWILLAIAPGLLSNFLAVLSRSTRSNNPLIDLVMFLELAMPVLMIVYLVVLSRHYVRARYPHGSGSGFGFVFGYGLLNLFLWGGSCVIMLQNMSFH